MPRRRLPEPLRLLRRVQSARLSLAKRLHALSQLAHYLDNHFCRLYLHAAGDTAFYRATPLVPADFSTQDAADLLVQVDQVVQHELLPLLHKRRITFVTLDELTAAQLHWLTNYFQRRIYPLLTPLAVDPAHPFPRIAPKQSHFLIALRSLGHPTLGYHHMHGGTERYSYSPIYQAEREMYGLLNLAAVQTPWIHLPSFADSRRAPQQLLWRETIIRHFVPSLFIGMEVIGIYQFRVLCLDQFTEDEQQNMRIYADTDRQPLRKQMPVVHINMEKDTPFHLVQWLVEHLHTTPECVSRLSPPLDFAGLQQLLLTSA